MARFPVERLSVTATWLSEVLRADVSEYRLEQIVGGREASNARRLSPVGNL